MTKTASVTVNEAVQKKLKAIRFDLSTNDRIVTYSEVLEQLIQIYEDKMNRKGGQNV